MIHTEINEEIAYKVNRMLDYEMENLPIDVYAKAELLVLMKYVVTHAEELRNTLQLEKEYEKECKNLIKKYGI